MQLIEEIKQALQDNQVGFYVAGEPGWLGHWIYPAGVVVTLNENLPEAEREEIERKVVEELERNRRAIELTRVEKGRGYGPVYGQIQIKAGVVQGPKQFQVEAPDIETALCNRLHEEEYCKENILSSRVEICFDSKNAWKLLAEKVDKARLDKVLREMGAATDYYHIEEAALSETQWLELGIPRRLTIPVPDSNLQVSKDPCGTYIENPSPKIETYDLSSLRFSNVDGLALLPDQRIELEGVSDILNSGRTGALTGTKVKQLIARNVEGRLPPFQVLILPSRLPYKPKVRTSILPVEDRQYQLLYLGECLRSPRTELYIGCLLGGDSVHLPTLTLAQLGGKLLVALNNAYPVTNEDGTILSIKPRYLFLTRKNMFRLGPVRFRLQKEKSASTTMAQSPTGNISGILRFTVNPVQRQQMAPYVTDDGYYILETLTENVPERVQFGEMDLDVEVHTYLQSRSVGTQRPALTGSRKVHKTPLQPSLVERIRHRLMSGNRSSQWGGSPVSASPHPPMVPQIITEQKHKVRIRMHEEKWTKAKGGWRQYDIGEKFVFNKHYLMVARVE